jgi:outer membrane protein OmpA-like peptidoglycan-associated protein
MAELNVQPKKRRSLLPWLLGALALIALIFIFTRKGDKDEAATAATTTDTVSNNTTDSSGNFNTASGWDAVDFNSPAVSYEEITAKNVNVRGANDYAIYSVGENILFDEGKSTIRSNAEKKLKQIAASIEKRYKEGELRVYGHTDSVGSSAANKQLGEQRAQAVRDWLTKNGNVSESRISLHSIGESEPVASNASEKGREQNRRVEIVARNVQ